MSNKKTKNPLLKEKWQALLAPFAPGQVKIKVQGRSKDRSKGFIVPYVEGNAIRERLDAVVGFQHWTATYTPILSEVPSVKCRLILGPTGADGAGELEITKENIGTGEDHKNACTDSLKRAAMEFGIGRYLWECPQVWIDLDDRGFIPDEGRTRALILHLLGYGKQEIEQAVAEHKRHRKHVGSMLKRFKSRSPQQGRLRPVQREPELPMAKTG